MFVFLFCWFKTRYSVSKRTALLHIKERYFLWSWIKTNSTLNTKRDVYNLFKWRDPLNHLTVKGYEFMGICSSQNPISTVYMYASQRKHLHFLLIVPIFCFEAVGLNLLRNETLNTKSKIVRVWGGYSSLSLT